MLQPLRRRTWAPRGQTPIQRSWDRHDRLSVVAAVTLSPQRCRRGAYFRTHDANITSDDLLRFLRSLRRQRRHNLLVVWDRWSVHRAAARRWADQGHAGIRFESLPAYAPELNPVEQIWNHCKYSDLANFVPADLPELDRAVRHSIARQHRNNKLLASYFRHAGLQC